jgi:hypothetical protein
MDRIKPITGRIVVTHQGPSGIVAKVNGEVRHFRDREALFRAAALLAEEEPVEDPDREALR